MWAGIWRWWSDKAQLPHLLTRSVGQNNWLTPPDPHEDIPIYGLRCASEGLKTTVGPDSLVFRGYFYRLAACLSGLGVCFVIAWKCPNAPDTTIRMRSFKLTVLHHHLSYGNIPPTLILLGLGLMFFDVPFHLIKCSFLYFFRQLQHLID